MGIGVEPTMKRKERTSYGELNAKTSHIWSVKHNKTKGTGEEPINL